MPLIPPPDLQSSSPLGTQSAVLSGEVVVSFQRSEFRRTEGKLVYDGGVVVSYGVTTLKADHVEFDLKPGSTQFEVLHGSATGSVIMSDPAGTISASKIEFDWRDSTGVATGAFIEIAGIRVKVEVIRFAPGIWNLTNLSASLCKDGHMNLEARRMSYRPGHRMDFYDSRFKSNGTTLVGLRHAFQGLGEEGRSAIWPDLIIGGDKELGLKWTGRIDLGKGLRIIPMFGTAQESKPWGEVMLFYPIGNSGSFRVPRSDTSDVSAHSYFENINVESVQQEINAERQSRGSIAIATSWNRGKFEDFSGETNRPYELIVEGGGKAKEFGWFLQGRLNRIDLEKADDMDRAVGLLTISPPPIHLSPSISVVSRIDSRTFSSQSTGTGGWLRGSIGFVAESAGRYSFGAAVTSAREYGVEPLPFEKISTSNSFQVRFDWLKGPTRAGVLFKYDLAGNRWYDSEYRLSQVAGCLEPFVTYRTEGQRLRFGLTIRPLEKLNEVSGSLKNRKEGNTLGKEP